MLSFFSRGVLDEILNLIESVSEGFPSYSYRKLTCLTNILPRSQLSVMKIKLYHTMFLYPCPLDSIIIDDVKDVLDNLSVTKSCGPDLMSPRLLKEGYLILSKPYSFLFNPSLRHGNFPTAWKFSNIIPTHKRDDIPAPSNYRPVSLLCHSAKVLKRCIHKTLYHYINEHTLLTPFQSGFIQGDSATLQLLHTYYSFCEVRKCGLYFAI